jgi:hypothetical protein
VQLLPLLQRPSWTEYLSRIAGPTLLALVFTSLVRQPDLRQLLKQLVVASFIAAFAAKEIADFPVLWKKAHSDFQAKGGLHRLLSAFIAPEALGLIQTLWCLMKGFLCWMLRQHPCSNDRRGTSIPYLKLSGYGAVLPFALLALLVDVPVSAVILPALGVEESLHMVIRIAVLLVGLATLAGVLGDRWHISTGNHILTDDSLLLKVGVRYEASVPRCAIDRAELVGRTEKISPLWSKREIIVSPFDKPNVRLLLSDRPCVNVTAWGCTFNEVRCIYLYVDDPKRLLSQLRAEA